MANLVAQSARQRTRISRVSEAKAGSNRAPNSDHQANIVHFPIGDLHLNETQIVKNLDQLTTGALAIALRSGQIFPIHVDGDGTIIVGEEWYCAYKEMGCETVPTISAAHLSRNEARALRLASRRLAQMVDFEPEALAYELKELLHIEPDLVRMTPWSMPEIDRHIAIAEALVAQTPDQTEALPELPLVAVSQPQMLWEFSDGSRLLHGNACDSSDFQSLFGPNAKAHLIVTDPPYGLPIRGVVSRTHQEFIMGSGINEEQARALFRDFLKASKQYVVDGGMVDVFIDHRSMFALLGVLREVGIDLKSICVWDKQAAGMGSPFRNRVEFCLVGKVGTAKSINNIELGRYGRNRSTLWGAPGYAAFGLGRAEALDRHPTCKPVGLIADAILDFSHRGHIVLDPFIGSGTTLLAAARTGRICYGIELDGKYVDVAIQQMQAETGAPAVLVGSNLTFDELRSREVIKPNVTRTRTRERLSGTSKETEDVR